MHISVMMHYPVMDGILGQCIGECQSLGGTVLSGHKLRTTRVPRVQHQRLEPEPVVFGTCVVAFVAVGIVGSEYICDA